MTPTKTETAGQRTDFVISRVFDAPRKLVWKAWTEAERLAQWWGPKGCTIRVVKLDVRPGGIFHYAMQFKPGHDMWGRFIYREIAAPERLIYISS
ncbi:MAG: SRPBCC domain-containing protein, partial [Rhizobiales bacterium]|nr:SRPBCC domain-containing protein [Hyphomicrobiales bacterium]